MVDAQQFSFTEDLDAFGFPDALPQLPLSLTYRNSTIEVSAVLDTGASVNVLPYSFGLQLGAVVVVKIPIETQKNSIAVHHPVANYLNRSDGSTTLTEPRRTARNKRLIEFLYSLSRESSKTAIVNSQ